MMLQMLSLAQFVLQIQNNQKVNIGLDLLLNALSLRCFFLLRSSYPLYSKFLF